MIPSNIPFEKVGIRQIVGDCVVDTINSFITKYPQKNINIQEISNNAGYTRAVIKRVLYVLLGLRHLKATFVPIHSICGLAVGQPESSVSLIAEKIENEDYFCIRCREVICESQEIQIQILFWEPGTNVA